MANPTGINQYTGRGKTLKKKKLSARTAAARSGGRFALPERHDIGHSFRMRSKI